MAKVLIYSKRVCPYCIFAKNLLNEKGVKFEETLVDDKPDLYQKLKNQTGHMTVPQIFINDNFIGGYDELKDLDDSGKLDQLLK